MTQRKLKKGEYIDDQGSIRDEKGQLVEPAEGATQNEKGQWRDKDGNIIAGLHLRDPRIAEEEQAEREFRKRYYAEQARAAAAGSGDPRDSAAETETKKTT